MTKKRHYAKYSKPQSTAPHSLESSGRQSNIHHEEPQSRSVIDILTNLRRISAAAAAADGGGGGTGTSSSRRGVLSPIPAVVPSPSVPPEIANLLLPGLLPLLGLDPTHHAGAAAGAGGGGGAAGGGGGAAAAAGDGRHRPAAPGFLFPLLAQSMLAVSSANLGLDMPGVTRPDRGSLVDKVLRQMALDWHIHKHFNYYLMHLHGPLRAALVSYLGQFRGGEKGVYVGDLRALLIPPVVPDGHEYGQDGGDGGVNDDDRGGEQSLVKDVLPSPSTLNDSFRYLDLSGSVGRSLSIKEVSDLLFPGGALGSSAQTKGKAKEQQGDDAGVLESWDLPDVFTPPRALLPNLTHLSLALDPNHHGQGSWRQLLAFASHLPMLTHLRLTYWPEPTLTPDEKYTTVVSPLGRRFRYGGTGFYGHTRDGAWAEAVLLVRKLSKALYGLEYLDLTGCASWFPALMERVDNDQVDWAGDWGKITTLVLTYVSGQSGDPDNVEAETARRAKAVDTAKEIEQHIRQQRAGQGRFITVEYDRDPDRKM